MSRLDTGGAPQSVAIDLHGIRKVIVVDHRDCGAYKLILGDDLAKDPAKETAVHARNQRALCDQITAKYKTLEVELALMNLKGKSNQSSSTGLSTTKTRGTRSVSIESLRGLSCLGGWSS